MNFYSFAVRQGADALHINPSKIWDRTVDVVVANWHLGFTAFGGPPVHFQILHKKYVEKYGWVDEQLYQEIFALSQALPGPASTKMLFCINYVRGGLLAAFGAFLLWWYAFVAVPYLTSLLIAKGYHSLPLTVLIEYSLPGAIGMYGLSLGVSRIGDTLPAPVYALLSGLNAATVGIIALAAVQLAHKAITDKITRVLVFLGGVAGMLYTALWFFPVLMAGAGLVTIVWDFRWLQRIYSWARNNHQPEISATGEPEGSSRPSGEDIPANRRASDVESNNDERPVHLRRIATSGDHNMENEPQIDIVEDAIALEESRTSNRVVPSRLQINLISWKTGICVISAFAMSFITIMVIRSLLKNPPRGVSIFGNLYLAGTIIFGGGPVVIPLLREYIVAEGWVSPRDFLLGLALIQSFPGPNFNFAVYLGSLAVAGTSIPSFLGALIGFLGIFMPGIIIVTGIMGLWSVLRSRRWLVSLLRGVNAGAVGLVFTAVYKLWQIGYVDVHSQSGSPLGKDPWWVAITATSFVGGAWFGFSAPFAILLGGTMGLAWYGVIKA